MNEYVKAIKVVHQLLILASSAVLAFALTPNLELKYERADLVLGVLQNSTPDSWDQYVFNVLKDSDKSEAKYVHQLVHTVDPTFPSDAHIPLFVYSDLHFPLNGSIIDAEQYFNTSQKIQTFSFKREQAAFDLQWKNATTIPNSAQSLINIPVQQPRISSVSISPPEGGWSGTKVHLVQMENQSTDRNAKMIIILDPSSMSRTQGISNTLTINMPTILQPVRIDAFAMNWLRKQDTEGILFSNGTHDPFRDLKPFIREIGGMGVSQARQRLQAKQEAQHGKIALFGLSVDEQSTVNVMPWVISGILIFFLAHLRQFRLISERITSEAPPWVGFFDDWAGQAISFVTIVIMPTFASYLLISRHDQPLQSTRIVTLSLSSVAIFSIWSYVELLLLRSRLKHL